MSYVVLARKWRPQSFEDLVGQEHVSATLANAIARGRVAHAFLFTGVRGVGKTTSARILAKTLNCVHGPTAKPCQQCAPCTEITVGSDVDVQEIDGASYNGVDEVRKLQESLPYRPARDRFKIFIVDEVHMLSNAAWNAFLKTLEEPPPHVKFIFATTEVHKVPVTILSRCQRYDFKLISAQIIAGRLREVLDKEGIPADDGAIKAIAREAAGSMRDAMSLLDQVIAWVGVNGDRITPEGVAKVLGVADRVVLHRLAEALIGGDPAACLRIVGELAQEGYDLPHVARDILAHLRDLVVARVCDDPGALLDLGDAEVADVKELASRADPDDLTRLHQGFSRAFDDITRSGQPRAALEMSLVRLSRRPPLVPVDELLRRLGDMERRLHGGGGGAPPAAGDRGPQRPTGGGPPPMQRRNAAPSAGADARPERPAPREPTPPAPLAEPPPAEAAPAPYHAQPAPLMQAAEVIAPPPPARAPYTNGAAQHGPRPGYTNGSAHPASRPTFTEPATPPPRPSFSEPATPPPRSSFTEPATPAPATRPAFTEPATPAPATRPAFLEPATPAPVTRPSFSEPATPPPRPSFSEPATPPPRPSFSEPATPSPGRPAPRDGGPVQGARPQNGAAPGRRSDDVSTLPSAVAPTVPVVPPSVDLPAWRAVIEAVRRQRAALAPVLEHALVVEVGPERAVLAYDANNSFLFAQVTEPSARQLLTAALQAHFKRPVEVTVDALAPGAAAVSVAQIETAERRVRVEAARRAVADHPLVAAARELLGAELRDIRLPLDAAEG